MLAYLINNIVNQAQHLELMALAERCQTNDGDLPAIYYHLLLKPRAHAGNVFCYDAHTLVGFLSVFFFNEKASEITLLIDPNYRRQGLAKAMLQQVLPLLTAKQIDTLLFSVPGTQPQDWLTTKGLVYQHSECHLERPHAPSTRLSERLTIRRAERADLNILCHIEQACFTNNPSSSPGRFLQLLNDPDYQLFIADYNQEPIGKAHLRKHQHKAILSDIGILPDFQGQGLGSELLSFCIHHAQQQGFTRVALDVETHNETALKLYLNHGFNVVSKQDFYQFPFSQAKIWLDSFSPRPLS